MDYKDWFSKLTSFVAKIRLRSDFKAVDFNAAPPILPARLREWATRTKIHLSPSLSQFLTTVAEEVRVNYVFDSPKHRNKLYQTLNFHSIYGGGVLGGLDQIANGVNVCREYEEEYLGNGLDTPCNLSEVVPFFFMSHGDMLGIITSHSQEGTVVYLPAFGASIPSLYAESFRDFMLGWEGICYAGPHHLDSTCLDPLSGFSHPDLPTARFIRDIMKC